MSWNHGNFPAVDLCLYGVPYTVQPPAANPIPPNINPQLPNAHVPALFPQANPCTLGAPGIVAHAAGAPPPITQFEIPGTFYFFGIRRPCSVTLNVGQGNNSRSARLVIYHAPVAYPGPEYGIYACNLLAEVRQHRDIVLAGDFNFVTSNDVITAQTNAGIAMTAGTPAAAGLPHLARTSVHATTTAAAPLTSQDFYGRPRDILFYRLSNFNNPLVGGQAISGPVDVLTEMTTAGWAQSFLQLTNGYNFTPILQQAFPNPAAGSTEQRLTQVITGVVPQQDFDLKSAALFYNTFITDHLPLRVTLQF
jgi:hypothetical protein